MHARFVRSLAVEVVAAIVCMTVFASSAIAAPGDELWASSYDGPDNTGGRANDLAVSPDGSQVFVTGYVRRFNGDNYATIAYDTSTGATVWARRYNGPGDGTDQATAIGASPDGSAVYVTGWSYGTGTLPTYEYATIAYDSLTGDRLWLRRFTPPTHRMSQAYDLGVSPDGSTVFVTGTSDNGTTMTGSDYATVAYDAGTGAELWHRRYDAAHSFEEASALGVSPDGVRVFVTGYSVRSGSGRDYATIAYDATSGKKLWGTRYDGNRSFDDRARAIAVAPDGRSVFVTGDSDGSKRQHDYATVSYRASTGVQRWVRRYDGPAGADDIAEDIAISPGGSRVFVTGVRAGHHGWDYATVSYAASTGAQRWLRSYDGPAGDDDVGTAAIVSPDGSRVYITGYSGTSTFGSDAFATIAYDSHTGVRVWAQRYVGQGGSGMAWAIGVSGDGSALFVGGTGNGLTTVAYDAA